MRFVALSCLCLLSLGCAAEVGAPDGVLEDKGLEEVWVYLGTWSISQGSEGEARLSTGSETLPDHQYIVALQDDGTATHRYQLQLDMVRAGERMYLPGGGVTPDIPIGRRTESARWNSAVGFQLAPEQALNPDCRDVGCTLDELGASEGSLWDERAEGGRLVNVEPGERVLVAFRIAPSSSQVRLRMRCTLNCGSE